MKKKMIRAKSIMLMQLIVVYAMLCTVADISLVVCIMVSWWRSTSDNILVILIGLVTRMNVSRP